MFDRLATCPRQNLLACLVEVNRGKIHVLDRDELVIGRCSSADIQVKTDSAISRRHAVITLINGEFYIQDLGSKNGTVLNTKRVLAGRLKLKPDDKLTVGKTVYFFSPVGISEALYGSARQKLSWSSRLQLRLKACRQIAGGLLRISNFNWSFKPLRQCKKDRRVVDDDAITEPIQYIELEDISRHRI